MYNIYKLTEIRIEIVKKIVHSNGTNNNIYRQNELKGKLFVMKF